MEQKTISEHYQRVIDTLQKEIVEKDKRIAELEALLPKWHKVSEDGLPNSGQYVLVSYKGCKTLHCIFDRSDFGLDSSDYMWCELPQPPKEG